MLYGVFRQRSLDVLEAGKAEIKEQRRIEKAKQLEIDKQLALEKDLIEMISIFTNKPVSSFIGEMAEKMQREQSTQTVPDTKNVNMENSTVSETNNARGQNVGVCDENVPEVYENDSKQSCSTPVDNNDVDSSEIDECRISKNYSTDNQSSDRKTTGRQDVGEVDPTNDNDWF